MFQLDTGKLKANLKLGLKKGLKGSFWILKLFIPVSLLAVLLDWFGVVTWLEPVFKPAMSLINLPPEASFPIMAGIFVDVYGSVAVMAVLDFSIEQQILIILFSAISHSLIIEGIIQWRSGINFFKVTIIRLGTSILAVYLLSLAYSETQTSIGASLVEESNQLSEALTNWLIDISLLSLQITVVVILIMVLQELAISYGLIEKGKKLFSPILRVMGLSDQTMTPWLVAILGGVTIGSAVIIEECRRGNIPAGELQFFHVSVGINHSMVEHSAVLSAIVGANIFLIVVIRLVSAILVTHAMRIVEKLLKFGGIKPKFS